MNLLRGNYFKDKNIGSLLGYPDIYQSILKTDLMVRKRELIIVIIGSCKKPAFKEA